MKKFIKKATSFFLAALLGATCLAGAGSAFAQEAGIKIDETSFPDTVWRQAVLDQVDKDGNGYLSDSEAAITSLQISGWVLNDEIKDLKGIEYFTSAESLYIGDLGIETMDLSALKNLKFLRAQGNKFTSVDLSANTMLTDVNIRGNKQMTSLTLGSGVLDIECDECALTSLDVSVAPDMVSLICYGNNLISLDLTKNPKLEYLNCSENHLKELDLSQCSELAEVVSDYHIGDQTIELSAYADNASKLIYISLPFSQSGKLTGSNIKNSEFVGGYDDNASSFVFDDYDCCVTGIDYTYSVGLSSNVDMTVHVTVDKDFYKVTYLDKENGSQYYFDLVTSGDSVDLPAYPETAPEGYVCPKFSDTANNITADKTIYVIWAENHTESITTFANGVANVKCSVCGAERTVTFAEHLNAVKGSDNYESVLDADGNGVINSRDYALLIKQY